MQQRGSSAEWRARYWRHKAQAQRELIDTVDRMLAEALATGAGVWNDDTEARWEESRARMVAELEAFEANAAAYAKRAEAAQNTNPGEEMRLVSEQGRELRKRFPQEGPVVWCERCHAEPVEFDWRKEAQVCGECEAKGDA